MWLEFHRLFLSIIITKNKNRRGSFEAHIQYLFECIVFSLGECSSSASIFVVVIHGLLCAIFAYVRSTSLTSNEMPRCEIESVECVFMHRYWWISSMHHDHFTSFESDLHRNVKRFIRMRPLLDIYFYICSFRFDFFSHMQHTFGSLQSNLVCTNTPKPWAIARRVIHMLKRRERIKSNQEYEPCIFIHIQI